MNNKRVKGGSPYRAGWENGSEMSGHLSTGQDVILMKGWDEMVRVRKMNKWAKERSRNRAAEEGRVSQK